MTRTDWITLIVPIILNGILLFAFQKGIEKSIGKQKKRDELRDRVIILFWEKLQALNDTMLAANIATQEDKSTLQENLNRIKESVFSIVTFYDTNKYDLEVFESTFKEWNDAWNRFVHSLNVINETTMSQMECGKQLQVFKNYTEKLIALVRKKY